MTNEERDFLNKIGYDKSKNIPLFNRNALNEIHTRITNRLQRIVPEELKQTPKIQSKASKVIKADVKVREAIKELLESLIELNDKEIAKKLISEHIWILNEIFKSF